MTPDGDPLADSTDRPAGILALRSRVMAHEPNLPQLIDIALERIRLAERGLAAGSAAKRIKEIRQAVVGTAGLRRSVIYRGPRGGRTLIVAHFGVEADAAGLLSLARTAIEAMRSPPPREVRTMVGDVVLASALLASDADPDASMWAGFADGPCGPPRAESFHPSDGRHPKVRGVWRPTDALDGIRLAPTTPAVHIEIARARQRGGVPPMITISPLSLILQPAGLERLTPADRLRLLAATTTSAVVTEKA